MDAAHANAAVNWNASWLMLEPLRSEVSHSIHERGPLTAQQHNSTPQNDC
jgi:hypothetical protein